MNILETVTPAVDFSGLLTTLTTAITPAMILGIISSVVGAGILFVLMWFGVRKLTTIFSTSLKTGRLKI